MKFIDFFIMRIDIYNNYPVLSVLKKGVCSHLNSVVEFRVNSDDSYKLLKEDIRNE